MEINISGVTDSPFQVGDIVREKGIDDAIGVVVEGFSDDLNVVILLDSQGSCMYINHGTGVTQEHLKAHYSLISPSERNTLNIASKNNKIL